MNDTIDKAIFEAVDYLTDEGPATYCETNDDAREDIKYYSSGYAWYPDHAVPRNFTMDSFVSAAVMEDGRICLVDGGGDWELEEARNVGAQGIAALQDLANFLKDKDDVDYQRDYLNDYVRDAKRVWLNDILERLAKEDYEPYVEVDEELSDAASKAYYDDDEDSILYVLDHIEDVADILGRL